LGDYQVRNWIAWHHHQTLSLLAAWFLNQETRRGKNPDSGHDIPATASIDRRIDRRGSRSESTRFNVRPQHPMVGAKRASEILFSSFA
jgi:hypothetical protein